MAAEGASGTARMTSSERADALEHKMIAELDKVPVHSVLFTSGDQEPTGPGEFAIPPGKHALQGPDPRLKPMPPKPTLLDFFTYRFGPANHLLQSATLRPEGRV